MKQVYVDSDTGIIADTIIKGIDENKVKEDAQYDGYFCIITSEINYDNNKIHEVYGELEKIEESFKICKTNLKTRPMYVRTDSHIKAHLTICFVSLLICQLLLLKLSKEKISIERIQRALSTYSCEEIIKGVMHLTLTSQRKQFKNKFDKKGNEYTTIELSQDDEIKNDLLKIQKAFGEEFIYSNVKQEKLNKYLKSIKFAITK